MLQQRDKKPRRGSAQFLVQKVMIGANICRNLSYNDLVNASGR
jgi:hypothetical protein